jgi:hypothetical protein
MHNININETAIEPGRTKKNYRPDFSRYRKFFLSLWASNSVNLQKGNSHFYAGLSAM